MNENVKVVFGLIGGLALFLYGMNSMSDALQKAAGERMKKILGFLTRNPIMGALAGALVTAVLQSSSATTVMVIGFVSAGLMSLPQAISIIFGANIGTTMTAQIIAFKISDYIYIIIFIGFIISFIAKSEKVKSIGQTIFAFGLLFLGIETMGDVMKPLASSPVFTDLIERVAHIPVLGVFVGTLMTLVVQSSSATIAVLQSFEIGTVWQVCLDLQVRSRSFLEIISVLQLQHFWQVSVRQKMRNVPQLHIVFSIFPDVCYLSGL